MHAHLHQCLRNGTLTARDESVVHHPCEITFRRGCQPRGLLLVSPAVPLNEYVEGTGGARLVFEHERQSENGEEPEAIRHQNMVEQLTQFAVGGSSVVLPHGTEHSRIRVPVMGNQITQHPKHMHAILTEELCQAFTTGCGADSDFRAPLLDGVREDADGR
jgi:hypothetical protein